MANLLQRYRDLNFTTRKTLKTHSTQTTLQMLKTLHFSNRLNIKNVLFEKLKKNG